MNELNLRENDEIDSERESGEENACELQVVRDDEGRCTEIRFDGAFRIRL